jgi:hypothetical protein
MDGLALDEQQQHKGCRLAAVNKFTINPDEPVRSLQELVQGLVEELSSGQCCHAYAPPAAAGHVSGECRSPEASSIRS